MELALMILKFIQSRGKALNYSISENFDGEKKYGRFRFSDILKSNFLGETMNFFPSRTKGKCHDLAVFVSLQPKTLKFKPNDNDCIPFDKVINVMIQQVLGSCININKRIIVLTDNIDTSVVDEWKPNFKAIKKNSEIFDIFFVDNNGKINNINFMFGI